MNNWTIIKTFVYPQDAYMAKAYLESAGGDTLLQDELTAQVNNFYSNAIGGVKLWVRDEHLSEGVKLLQEGGYITSADLVQEDEVWIVEADKTTDRTCCPFCGSSNIGVKKSPDVIMIVIYFLLSALFPIFKSVNKCFDCDKVWKFKKKRNHGRSGNLGN